MNIELLILLSRDNPAIIGITEVKPKNCRYPADWALLAVDGCELYDNSGGNGRCVCLYVHKSLTAVQCCMSSAFEESVFVTVCLLEDKLLF